MAGSRNVSWDPGLPRTTKPRRRNIPSGQVDLSVRGDTHRVLGDIAVDAVVNRVVPKRIEDESLLNLALTSRSKTKWNADQTALTEAIVAAYGSAGGGLKQQLQPEDMRAVADKVRAEFVPKVRKTVRALQNTLRAKKEAASNPMKAPAAKQGQQTLMTGQQQAYMTSQARGEMYARYRARGALHPSLAAGGLLRGASTAEQPDMRRLEHICPMEG